MQNQHNTITNNAKSHIQRNKLLVRSQGAITRQVANSITRKTTPPIKIKGAWGPSTTTPSRTREATERGPGGGGGASCHDGGERHLRRAGFQNFTDLLGYIFILLIPEKVDDNTHHIWRASNFFRSAWPDSLAQSANC